MRDGCCVWPGCEVPAGWCDLHHHERWELGGRTAAVNGMLLCRPDGRELDPDPWAQPPPDHPPDPPPHAPDLDRAA